MTNVIGTLYLNNPNASPEQVAQFIDHRWGTHGEAVLDLLTTDTEVWTTELGVTMGVRSGCPRLTYCDRRGIAFVPYRPLAAGTLARTEQAPGDTATTAQATIAYLLGKSPNMLPIPGTSDPRHLEDNTSAASARTQQRTGS